VFEKLLLGLYRLGHHGKSSINCTANSLVQCIDCMVSPRKLGDSVGTQGFLDAHLFPHSLVATQHCLVLKYSSLGDRTPLAQALIEA